MPRTRRDRLLGPLLPQEVPNGQVPPLWASARRPPHDSRHASLLSELIREERPECAWLLSETGDEDRRRCDKHHRSGNSSQRGHSEGKRRS